MDVRALRHVFGRDRNSPQIDTFSKFHYEGAFHELPDPTGAYPFRLDLEDVLSRETVEKIAQNKIMVFHTVGDTGNYRHGADAQNAVAEHMVQQIENAAEKERPQF